MSTVKNIFRDLTAGMNEESAEEILCAAGFRLERIISNNSSSPDDFWYDQDTDEFVVLLTGSAAIRFEEGDLIELRPGDYLNIKAHRKHRVDRTDPDQKTTWLALHY